jgi:hypothetical protein
VFKRKFIQRVETVNGDIRKETWTNQWFLFGVKFYQSEYDYKNEANKIKPGFIK